MIAGTRTQVGQEYINPIDGVPVVELMSARRNMSPVPFGWDAGQHLAHDGFCDDQEGEEEQEGEHQGVDPCPGHF